MPAARDPYHYNGGGTSFGELRREHLRRTIFPAEVAAMTEANDNPLWPEHAVTIDGELLEHGDVMTTRVALANFVAWLDEPETAASLGAIGPLYKQRAEKVLVMLSRPLPQPTSRGEP